VLTVVVFSIVGVIIALLTGVVAYIWRKRTLRWWRVFGGITLVLLPIYSFFGISFAAELTSRTHVLHSLPPESDITYFEAALISIIFFGSFWSFGALCGIMVHSLIERPLRF
jgi:hypothetical protein